MTWIDIGPCSDFPIGTTKEVVAAGRILAVSNVDNTLYAMEGICPHAGGPLGKGELVGCVLTCPWHGLQFDVRDGTSQLSGAGSQPMFEIKTEDGRVFVSVDPRSVGRFRN